jgi:hypothetical protein
LSKTLNIRLNPNAEIEQHPINEKFTAIVVDDFLLNPDEVLEFAVSNQAAFEMPERSYPGKVLDLDATYFRELTRFVRSSLSRVFSFARSDLQDTCQFSLTTLQPHEFSWIQRLPHTDYRRDPGRENYALLVYLFDKPEMGGTGFFRYRDEKFWESMAPRQFNDPDGGLETVQTRYPMFLEPPVYSHKSDEAVELITSIPAKFNRMICYSGDVPHSACIPDASLLSDDCKTGRLTLNSFASVWPKT